MGSQAEAPPCGMAFNLTGFNKFYNVPENPTMVLMAKIREFMELRALPLGATVESCTVLETAGLGGLQFLLDLLDSKCSDEEGACNLVDSEAVPQRISLDGHRQVVWIHFGVDTGASRFKVEQRAVNEATFRCPDEMGWQPVVQRIVDEDGSLSNVRETVFPTHRIVAELVKLGFDAAVSYDAGLFVCNYVYYQSLRHAASHGTKCLFVHVPPFTVSQEKTQLEFVAALLNVLATILIC